MGTALDLFVGEGDEPAFHEVEPRRLVGVKWT
jgi:hypothetical protein